MRILFSFVFSPIFQHSPEKGDNYLEFTRCHGHIGKSGDGDVEGNEMEMTRINEKSIVVSASTNECNVRVGNKVQCRIK